MTHLPPLPFRPQTPGPACAEILEYAAKAPRLDFTAALKQAQRDDLWAARRNRHTTTGRICLTKRQPPHTINPFIGG